MLQRLLPAMVFVYFICAPAAAGTQAQKAGPPQKAIPKVVKTRVLKEVAPSPQEEQRVFIDPVTRRPRQPTPEELRALAAASTREPRAVRELEFQGGGVIHEMELDVFSDVLVATVNKDGSVTMRCVHQGVRPEVPTAKKPTATEVK